LLVFIDFIFILNIFVNFFITYSEEIGEVKNLKFMAIKYMTSKDLTIDLILAIPCNIINLVLGHKFLMLAQWIFIYLRFIKLLQFEENYILNILYVDDIELRRLLYFISNVLIIFHICTCFFIDLSLYENQYFYVDFLKKYALDSDLETMYLTSLYFHFTTVLTVGYGDVLCITSNEKVYNIILQLFGISSYSYIVSTLSYKFYKLDLNEERYLEYTELLWNIRDKYNIGDNLYTQVSMAINMLTKEKVTGAYELIDDLPNHIKNSIIYLMNQSKIKAFKIFSTNNKKFLNFILPVLNPLAVRKDDLIFATEDILDEMYIISHGLLSVCLSKEFDEIELYEIRKNDHFGEIILYTRQASPYDFKCKTDHAELFTINKDIFNQAKCKFEQEIMSMLEEAIEIIKVITIRQLVLIELFCYESDHNEIQKHANKIDNYLLNQNFDVMFDEGLEFYEAYNINNFFSLYNEEEICEILGIIRFFDYRQLIEQIFRLKNVYSENENEKNKKFLRHNTNDANYEKYLTEIEKYDNGNYIISEEIQVEEPTEQANKSRSSESPKKFQAKTYIEKHVKKISTQVDDIISKIINQEEDKNITTTWIPRKQEVEKKTKDIDKKKKRLSSNVNSKSLNLSALSNKSRSNSPSSILLKNSIIDQKNNMSQIFLNKNQLTAISQFKNEDYKNSKLIKFHKKSISKITYCQQEDLKNKARKSKNENKNVNDIFKINFMKDLELVDEIFRNKALIILNDPLYYELLKETIRTPFNIHLFNEFFESKKNEKEINKKIEKNEIA
jgi:hypothetical protein